MFDSNDYHQFGSQILASQVTSPIIIGNNNPNNPGVESMLDIEWIAATGVGAKQWFWIENCMMKILDHFFFFLSFHVRSK
jgi:hypothetical protein